MECRQCGHRKYAEIQPSPPWPPAESVEYRLVVHRTKGPAKALEVQALRKISPELRSLPVHVAAERVGTSATIDLGVHSPDDAKDLLKKAEALGLNARLEHPDDYAVDQNERFFAPFGAPVTVGEPGEGQVIPFVWILRRLSENRIPDCAGFSSAFKEWQQAHSRTM